MVIYSSSIKKHNALTVGKESRLKGHDIFGKYLAKILQGLSELAVNSFRLMTTEGLTPSLLALNSLINAFGEDRRDAEAFAVLQYMKENVCFSDIFFSSIMYLTCVFGQVLIYLFILTAEH